MFVGRKTECDKLNKLYTAGCFECAVIYGRRRVGKTTLIKEFIKGKKAIFFTASESTAQANLLSLSECIGGRSSAPVFRDYESALESVFDMAHDERMVFVIDEFPYLAQSYRGISSLLQILIDTHKETSKLMLILCGSGMSFMENQVLGYQSPLYGRRTAQFKILPFTFFEALPFLVHFCAADQALLYGAAGGVPEYLSKVDPQGTVRSNLINLFLTTSGHFFEEPANLLKQELREPATYNVIIESIACGASRLNEIAAKCGLESNKCAKYLSALIALGLIKKEYPYGETGGKRSIYKIEDNMFRFWYRFVFPNISAITAGHGELVYKNDIENQLNAYMGFIFEDICKQWLFALAGKQEANDFESKDSLPFFIGHIGRWWGTNWQTRKQEDIDIMSTRNDSALFAECKWKNADVGIDVFYDLKRRSELFGYKNVHLYLFVKESVTGRLYEQAAQGFVKLYTLADMIRLVL